LYIFLFRHDGRSSRGARGEDVRARRKHKHKYY
jgi:hypothetical protein